MWSVWSGKGWATRTSPPGFHLTAHVQTHLTHVYVKLGVASRVQLVQEAGRRA